MDAWGKTAAFEAEIASCNVWPYRILPFIADYVPMGMTEAGCWKLNPALETMFIPLMHFCTLLSALAFGLGLGLELDRATKKWSTSALHWWCCCKTINRPLPTSHKSQRSLPSTPFQPGQLPYPRRQAPPSSRFPPGVRFQSVFFVRAHPRSEDPGNGNPAETVRVCCVLVCTGSNGGDVLSAYQWWLRNWYSTLNRM